MGKIVDNKAENKPKSHIMFNVLVAVVVVLGASLAVILWQKSLPAKEEKITGEQLALSTISFVDSMNNDALVKRYVDCNGKSETVEENQLAPNAWTLLAYASVYDATGDTSYVSKIQGKEKILNSFYDQIFFEDGSVDIKILYPAVMMSYPLLRSLEYLKGKGALADEKSFEEKILKAIVYISDLPQDVNRQFSHPQEAAMYSNSLSYAAKFIDDQEQIKKLKDMSRFFLEESIMLSSSNKLEMCWVYLAQYNLDKSDLKADIDGFINELEEFVPVTVQPCIEALLRSYEDTGSKENLDLAIMLNNKLVQTANEGSCVNNAFKSGSQVDGKDTFYISDNAYEIYLLSRPGIKGGAIR